jgi:hypothetical protein
MARLASSERTLTPEDLLDPKKHPSQVLSQKDALAVRQLLSQPEVAALLSVTDLGPASAPSQAGARLSSSSRVSGSSDYLPRFAAPSITGSSGRGVIRHSMSSRWFWLVCALVLGLAYLVFW